MVFAGTVHSLDDFVLICTGRNGVERCMNSIMIANVIHARTVPYATDGAGVSVLRDQVPAFTFLVRDPDDHVTTSDLEKLCVHGVVLSALAKLVPRVRVVHSMSCSLYAATLLRL